MNVILTHQSFIIMMTTVLFLSCNKERDKWKQPVDVSFKVGIEQSSASADGIKFDSGYIVLSSFEFEGEREQGDDVYFEKEYEEGLEITFSPNQVINELDFEIPQGTYTHIEIELEIENEEGNSVLVEGTYTNSNGETIPLRLELEEAEIYRVTATDEAGNTEIILKTNVPVNSIITLDPYHWFGTVSNGMLDDAELADVSGTQTILVSPEYNEDLYEIVIARVNEETEIVFQ